MARTTDGTKTDGHWDLPLDRKGNVTSWPESHSVLTGEMKTYTAHDGTTYERPEWKQVEAPFIAFPPKRMRIRVIDMERGRSAARFTVQDIDTGTTYPLFMVDILKLLESVEFETEWHSAKRGQNYGITPHGDVTAGIVT